MTWTANPRALREWGHLLASPRAAANLRSRGLAGRPTLCVDQDDPAAPVLAAAAFNEPSVLAIRVGERSFKIFVQVPRQEATSVEAADDMTIGEWAVEVELQHSGQALFASAGELAATSA